MIRGVMSSASPGLEASLPRHRRTLRRVFPEPAGEVTVAEAYGVPRRRHADGRPWVGICMVSSLDGSTVVKGTSGALSSENDTAVLLTLRDAVDVLLVGAGTARAEGYGAPGKPGQRLGVVSTTGDVDLSVELFTSGAGFLIVPEDAPALPVDTVRAGRGRVDLPLALVRLGEVVGDVTCVQAEGGPRFNAALLDADVVDELDLTWSPQLAGGDGSRLTAGARESMTGFDLAHLLVDDDAFVYTRWLRRR
jgi:riboflavin biosynthesis pyrimidine reductase